MFAPAQIDGTIARHARDLAEKAVGTFAGAGIFGVEFFLLSDNTLVLNEIAPRVHNSGHFTIEACETSQFEQHVRAVNGLALGSGALQVGAASMVNILGTGDDQETFTQMNVALSIEGASVHWYGKGSCTLGRKMGHVTIVGTSMDEVYQRTDRLLSVSSASYPFPKLSPVCGIIMGSDSDLPVLKAAAAILKEFHVPFEITIVSAHRTPKWMVEYASTAHTRGLKVIIAAAGGAAHLPGMVAALTPLPVIGVPVALKHLDGVDSLHSIVQMPRGVPVATVAIDNSTNAALLAIRILSAADPALLQRMIEYQRRIAAEVQVKRGKLEEQGWEEYTTSH